MANIISRLETGTSLFQTLISDVKKGEIKIPQFQRKFVWKESQALELLDSIANSYPVGSLLFWRTNVKLAAERNIGDFKLPKTDDLTPTDYVLDGQQRLTVIYSCLGAPDSEEGFAAAYDLEKTAFVLKPSQHDPRIFPLRWMFETTKLLDFRTALKSFPKHAKYQEQLDSIIGAFTNYRVPVVTLKDLSIEEVCPIFERINSSGTKLSMFDLMVAATWSHREFDLNEKANTIAASLEAKGFDTIERDTILKCVTAVKFGGIKKDQVLALREIPRDEMDALVKATSEALLKAVDLLSTEFRIYSWDFLPYEALLIVLCYVLSKSNGLSGDKVVRVRQWFWRASFNERYRVGGEGFVSKDLEDVRIFVVEGKGDPKFLGDVSSLEKSSFRIANSRARAFALSLAIKQPRNITNGTVIDTAIALSQFNKKQFHHIFPKAYLKQINEHSDHNSILNVCMLAASENNTVSDSDPHEYLPKYISELRDEAETVLESNFLPSPKTFDYKTESYSSFIKKREALLAPYWAALCDGNIH
jgi:hypothetical protein